MDTRSVQQMGFARRIFKVRTARSLGIALRIAVCDRISTGPLLRPRQTTRDATPTAVQQ